MFLRSRCLRRPAGSSPRWGARTRACCASSSHTRDRGVDVSPIVWVALLSFLNEVLLGKQGLLILLASKQQ